MWDRRLDRRVAVFAVVALGAMTVTPAQGQVAASQYDSACSAYPMPGEWGMHRVVMDVSTATADAAPACGFNVGHTVWFEVSPDVDSHITFSTCDPQTTYDTVAQGWIRIGDCENPLRIDSWCDDDSPAGACVTPCDGIPRASIVTVQATAGTTYYFQVGSYDDNSVGCPLTLGVQLVIGPTPPVNDDCPQATPIGEGSFGFDTTAATTDGPTLPPSCEEGSGLWSFQDVWYRYTASCTGVATVDLCNSDYDTRLAVYDTNGFPGDLIACNDDSCGLRSRLQFQVSSGSEYFVRVAGFCCGGTGTMVVTCAAHVYLDLTRFEQVAAERGLVVRSFEDFSEAVIPDPPGEVEMNDPLDDETDNGVFAPGDIVSGIVLQSNLDGAGEGGVNPRGEGGLVSTIPIPIPQPMVGANVGTDGLDIVFGLSGPLPNEAGIGVTIADIDDAGEVHVSIYDANGELLTQIPVLDQPHGSFVGAIPINIPGPGEPVEIGRVNIWAPAGTREGVYEITVYAPPLSCPADVDDDGDVDFQDLLVMLAAWGPCEGCPADIDGNNQVNFQDLLALLAAWGPCLP